MLRGSSPCTDLSLVVRCDYVNERVNVKLALSFRTTWLNNYNNNNYYYYYYYYYYYHHYYYYWHLNHVGQW